MSKFTTEVRYICETAAGKTESVGLDEVEDVITLAAPKVFDFPFPIFDENYRLPLERKILRHYYTREIGFETVGLWKLKLRAKMCEIMPYYNKLYESELIEFNPMNDVNYKKEGKRQGTGTLDGKEIIDERGKVEYEQTEDRNVDYTDETHNTRTTHNTNRFSDTPQGDLTGMGSIEDNLWLTNATIDNGSIIDSGTKESNEQMNDELSGEQNTTKNTGKQTNNTTENTDEYIEMISGKRGLTSYSKLLQEFRETFLNIDMMIIGELEPLFFGLWE